MPNQNEQSHIQSLQQKTEHDSVDAVRQVYDDWATKYDDDLREMEYVAPQEATVILTQLLPTKNSLILDGGCGTGLIGQLLQQEGFTHLHGCDYSPEMLAEAEKTRLYHWLGVVDMTQTFPLENATYDASLCVGVLGPRLPSHPMIPELIRVVKPKGLMLAVIREQWYADRLRPTIEQVIVDGQATMVHEEIRPYFEKGNINGRYIALQKQA